MCEPPARGDFVSPLAAVAEVLSECRLLSYMSQMSMRMSFLFRLINIIHVQTLTQVKSCRDLAVASQGLEWGAGLGAGRSLVSLEDTHVPFFLLCAGTLPLCAFHRIVLEGRVYNTY